MQISFQDTDQLTKVLTLTITPEDYKAKVERELQRLRKTITLPGFRPGTAPENIIRRRFGNSTLSDELNAIINKALGVHLDEIKPYMGQALPITGQSFQPDINNLNRTYTYAVEVGIHPTITLPDFTSLPAIPRYNVSTNEEVILKAIASIKKSEAIAEKITEGQVQADDVLVGHFTELNDDHSVKENGIDIIVDFNIKLITNTDIYSQVLQMNIGDDLILTDIWSVFSGTKQEIVDKFFISQSDIDNISSVFRLGIIASNRLIEPELDKAFFTRKGEFDIQSEKELKETLRATQRKEYRQQEYHRMKKEIKNILCEHIEVPLPEAFLKRYLGIKILEKERKIKGNKAIRISQEVIDKEYDSSKSGIVWELILTFLAEKAEIKVTKGEISDMIWLDIHQKAPNLPLELVKSFFKQQHDEQMEDGEHVRMLAHNLLEFKSINWAITKINTVSVDISYEEYYNILRNQPKSKEEPSDKLSASDEISITNQEIPFLEMEEV